MYDELRGSQLWNSQMMDSLKGTSAFCSRQLSVSISAYSVFSPATQSTVVSHQQNGLKHAQQHEFY